MERCNMWDNVENAFCTFLEFPTKESYAVVCFHLFGNMVCVHDFRKHKLEEVAAEIQNAEYTEERIEKKIDALCEFEKAMRYFVEADPVRRSSRIKLAKTIGRSYVSHDESKKDLVERVNRYTPYKCRLGKCHSVSDISMDIDLPDKSCTRFVSGKCIQNSDGLFVSTVPFIEEKIKSAQ